MAKKRGWKPLVFHRVVFKETLKKTSLMKMVLGHFDHHDNYSNTNMVFFGLTLISSNCDVIKQKCTQMLSTFTLITLRFRKRNNLPFQSNSKAMIPSFAFISIIFPLFCSTLQPWFLTPNRFTSLPPKNKQKVFYEALSFSCYSLISVFFLSQTLQRIMYHAG